MRDYHNEEDIDDLYDAGALILEELKDLFGLYEKRINVNSVYKFLIADLPDVRHKEVVQFVKYWAGLEQVKCPLHKDIKKYILQMRLRDKCKKDFQASDKCPHDKCDGGGFIVGIKDGYHHAFNCKCNPKGGLEDMPPIPKFDSTIGEKSGR